MGAVVLLAVLCLLAGVLGLGVAGPAGADQGESAVRRVASASITAGYADTCALLATGTVRCWGYNSDGELGHNNTTNVGDGVGSDPSIKGAGDVPLGGTAVAVSAGVGDACALLSTGKVRCWGYGYFGQLGHNHKLNVGDGGTDPSIKKAGDVPLGGTAVAIAAGGYHTCALTTTGSVRCWGYGLQGQLGYGNRSNVGDGGSDASIKAAGDVPLGGTAVAIAAGVYHTCALLTTGAVRCWGYNGFGQLGHGNTTNIGDGGGDSSISQAGNVPLGGTAVAIAAGDYHTCALMTTGAVRCWGHGAAGQLGHDSTFDIGGIPPSDSIKKAGDVPLGGTAVAITAGDSHTCALMATGQVRCWGAGADGQLGHDAPTNVGDGGSDPSIQDAGDVPLGGRAVAVTAGGLHTCALLSTGTLRCWGQGTYGQLGHDNEFNVGAGGTSLSIQDAGVVPVGAPVRVRATPHLAVRIRPARDRLAPYVYRVTGHLQGRFVPDPASCTGRVTLTVRNGGHLLRRRTARLDGHCGYRLRTRVTAHQVPTHRTTKLTVKVRYPGSRNLTPTAVTRHVTAH